MSQLTKTIHVLWTSPNGSAEAPRTVSIPEGETVPEALRKVYPGAWGMKFGFFHVFSTDGSDPDCFMWSDKIDTFESILHSGNYLT